MKAKNESRTDPVRMEVFEGSTFYAPRKYLHRFARRQDAINRFGRYLHLVELQHEGDYGVIVLQTKPEIEPLE